MADTKIAYGSSAALTITLASLASSATLVAGRESTAIVNTSNLFLDYLLAGKITTGTSPTDVRNIQVWVYAQFEDTPTYPDGFTGSDAAKTVTSENIRNASLARAAVMATNNTSDRTFWFRPVSIASLFGGSVPKRWGAWVVHDTGVALNATAGNHALWYTPIFATVT